MSDNPNDGKKVSGNQDEKKVISTRTGLLAEIETERQSQIAHGYGTDHDDEFGVEHLATEVGRRVKFSAAHITDAQARVKLVHAAALALAAIEVIDRRAGENVSNSRVDLNDLAARNAARRI